MTKTSFTHSDLQLEYDRLGYELGWTFMMTPEKRLHDAGIAFIGLNPGGGRSENDRDFAGIWDCPSGNAYFIERWGPGDKKAPIQNQLDAWHRALDVNDNETLCAQFVPFRSADWDGLPRKAEALAVAGRLWSWALAVSPASVLVTMGKLPGQYLGNLLKGRVVATLPAGWGSMTIDVWETPSGRRIVAMPHPSRYQLFGRTEPHSDTAEASLRIAAGLKPRAG
ncbi:hypothetical protein [Sphingomonas aerolata]|uniref:hypothetical protein n=1 Tax=Sphingomonas aerolata TaxID=185951 RepID=UPI00141AC7A4|nr:hypothetical protein [Sphingomonas aerolata]NII58980.1 uracil-DNA glycosylase [Sphingomonas aerolata]